MRETIFTYAAYILLVILWIYTYANFIVRRSDSRSSNNNEKTTEGS